MAPSSGNCGVSSPPHNKWNSADGMSIGTTGATGSSLTNTDLPDASWPVTTRRTFMGSVNHLSVLLRRSSIGGNLTSMEQKPTTAVIESAHRAHLNSLPFSDTTDFDAADRGLIAAQQPCVIKAADGRVVWANEASFFLTADETRPST